MSAGARGRPRVCLGSAVRRDDGRPPLRASPHPERRARHARHRRRRPGRRARRDRRRRGRPRPRAPAALALLPHRGARAWRLADPLHVRRAGGGAVAHVGRRRQRAARLRRGRPRRAP